MAEIEKIDIVKLVISSSEFELIKRALDIADSQFPTMADDDRARNLLRELNG